MCFNCVLLKDSISRRRFLRVTQSTQIYLGALIFRFSVSGGRVGTSLGGGGGGALEPFLFMGTEETGGGGGFLLTGSGGGAEEMGFFFGAGAGAGAGAAGGTERGGVGFGLV